MTKKGRFYLGFVLILFLLPQVVRADGLDNAVSYLIVFDLILINIPAVIAFLVLRFNLSKPGLALIINFLIWMLYMVPFCSDFMLWVENDFRTENYFIETPHGLLTWIPITFVFVLTVVSYLNSRNKKVRD